MSLNTWSSVELTKCEWSSYWKSSTGQPEMSFTDDEEVITYFTEGACNALAWELHKLTGWSLAILSDRPIKDGNYGGHAFIINSEGLAIDIKGVRTLEDIRDDWYFCGYLTRFFTADDYAKEMSKHWDSHGPHYTKDREAKLWAKKILDMLK